MGKIFEGRVLYSNNVIGILFTEEMEVTEKHSIFLVQNYSFIDDLGNIVSLDSIIQEPFFCNSSYGENIICFKVREEKKDILENYKLRFGDILLKDVNYITNKKGEIYEICERYNISLYNREVLLKDFKFEFIDKYTISVQVLSELYIKSLEKDDLIFESNGKRISIKTITKESLRSFKIYFNEPIAETSSDEIILKVSEGLEIKNTMDILSNVLKRGDKIYIKNKIKASLKNISLISVLENKAVIELYFDIDILKYSSNDFSIKVNEKTILGRGHSNYLKEGEKVLLTLDQVTGVDVQNPNIYIKTEEISRLFTLGYNKLEIERFPYTKVESFLVDYVSLKLGEEAVLNAQFNNLLQSIEREKITYLIKKNENNIILENKEYGSITLYYEVVPVVDLLTLEWWMKTDGNTLSISGNSIEFSKLKGFIYADFVSGEKIKSYDGIKSIQNFNVPIDYEEEESKVLYSRPNDVGDNWSFLGMEVNTLTIIEIDNSNLIRVYGALDKETIFNSGVKLVYVGKEKAEEIKVYLQNIRCNRFIIEADDVISVTFRQSVIKEIVRA